MRDFDKIPRISVTGPDGVGKDTGWLNAKKLLPSDLVILKVGRPSSLVVGGHEEFVHTKATSFLNHLHQLADKQRNLYLTGVVNVLNVTFQWRFQEPYLIRRFSPDLVFSLRDAYLDPAAYSVYYLPGTLGRMPIPQRIDFLHALLASPYRDHSVFLDIDPKTSVERIDKRIADGAIGHGRDLPDWKHQHETVESLRMIRDEFLKTAEYLAAHKGTRVTIVDTNKSTRGEVAQIIAGNIMSAYGGSTSRGVRSPH